jgi:hypothetical protein
MALDINELREAARRATLTAPPSVAEQASANCSITTVGDALRTALAISFTAVAATVVIDRVLGGGWRSWWSILSSFSMCTLGAYGMVASTDTDNDCIGSGLFFGGIGGAVYGVSTSSFLSGTFYGCCIGIGWAFLIKRATRISDPLMLGVFVLGGMYFFHIIGMLPPTKLIR